jgi:PAS domain S-box-containing protein
MLSFSRRPASPDEHAADVSDPRPPSRLPRWPQEGRQGTSSSDSGVSPGPASSQATTSSEQTTPAHDEPPTRARELLRGLAPAAGLVAFAVGSIVLAGWVLKLDLLKSGLPGVLPMNPNTAFCFMFAGAAMCVLSSLRLEAPLRIRLASGLALVPLTFGFLSLVGHSFGLTLWADHWLAWLIPGTAYDGRLTPLSGLLFVLFGGGLTLTDWVTRRGYWPAQLLALAVAALAFESLLNYAYGSPLLYLGEFSRISLLGGATFLILALGLFFLNPSVGLAGEVTSPSLGGLILRRVLLAAICLLPLMGCIRLLAEKARLVDSAHATSLLVLASLGMFTVLVWRTAKALNETDRSRTVAEEALRLRNQELTNFFENASVGISWVGPEGTIQWANRAELDLLGYRREEYIGQTVAAFHLDPASSREILKRWRKGETLQNHEMRLRAKDGSPRIVSINSSPHYKNGRLVHTRCFNRDVTERKAAEEALRISQQKLSAIFNQVTVGIVQADQSGRLVLMNHRFCEIVGRSMEQLLRFRLQDIIYRDDLPEGMGAFEKARSEGQESVIEQRYVRPDGTVVWTRNSIARVTDAGGARHIVTLVEDVSERKRTEAALRTSEEEFRTMFELAGVGKAQIDPSALQFVRTNRRLGEITGFSASELASKKLLDLIAEEDQPAAHRELDKILRGEQTSSSIELRGLRKDGSVISVEISTSMAPAADGTPSRLFAVIQDVTERRRAEDEVRRLNAELDQRVQMRTAQLEATNKELEAFCYSVSHDLRAPLRNIVGFSQALLQDYGDKLDEQGKDYLQRAGAAGQRMTRLIEDLLHLSRVARSEMFRSKVNLSQIVQAVAAELRKGEPARSVHWKIASGVTAEGDPRLLRIAFENILGNAWKFTGKKEHPVIEFGQTRQDEERVFFVRDNGAGFEMAYAGKLFGVFQRLHPATDFPGTGIGLATVQRIINRHGGRIWAHAEPGQGATFYFTLPDALPATSEQ